jgi:hypothetical protein
MAEQITAEDRLHRADALDLEPVVHTLTHPGPGEAGLGLARADWEVSLYEAFVRTRRLFREHFGTTIGTQPAASACRNHGGGSDRCVGCVKPPPARPRPRPWRSHLLSDPHARPGSPGSGP